MRYLSVCSGIEAASVAWHPLGWKPVAFSEIEAFPSAVLAHRFPEIQNLGDMTAHAAWPIQSGGIDLLVGGTPCQSFSVAGLRKGLADPRGNLALVYLGIAARLRPRWIVWENVPGVLSSGGGRDFGAFLGALGQLGYGWAYRTLDAQWFGVAQRRRRVFVVAHLGDWRRAAAVLFEPSSLLRNPPSRGEARQATPSDAAGRSDDGRKWPADIAATLNAAFGEKQGLEDQHALSGASHFVPHMVGKWWDGSDCAASMTTRCHDQSMPDKGNFAAVVQAYRWQNDRDGLVPDDVVGLRASGGSSGFHEMNHPIVAQAFRKSKRAQSTQDDESWVDDGIANTLNGFDTGDTRTTHAVAVDVYNHVETGDVCATITSACGGANTSGPKAITGMVVRRLTPVECERLQGFPDEWTDIPYRGKPAPDGPRYKALGNSMAVPVMRWIGQRIAAVELLH